MAKTDYRHIERGDLLRRTLANGYVRQFVVYRVKSGCVLGLKGEVAYLSDDSDWEVIKTAELLPVLPQEPVSHIEDVIWWVGAGDVLCERMTRDGTGKWVGVDKVGEIITCHDKEICAWTPVNRDKSLGERVNLLEILEEM